MCQFILRSKPKKERAARSLSPYLLQKQIPVAMRVRSGLRIGAQAHHLPVARGIVGWPVRCSGAVWISRFGKIRPEGLYQVRKLVILRLECSSLARVEIADDVLNLVGVEGPGRDR